MAKSRENQTVSDVKKREYDVGLVELIDDKLLNIILDFVCLLDKQRVVDVQKIRSLKLSKEMQLKVELYLDSKSKTSEKAR